MPLMSPAGIYSATFLVSFVGGVVPFLNVEAYLLSLSVLSPGTSALPTAVAASAGQMAAKALLYMAGRGLLRVQPSRSPKVLGAAARLAGAKGRATTLILASAFTGIPPFYGVSLAAGLLRFPFMRFLAVGFLGRVLRFAGVFLFPRVF